MSVITYEDFYWKWKRLFHVAKSGDIVFVAVMDCQERCPFAGPIEYQQL